MLDSAYISPDGEASYEACFAQALEEQFIALNERRDFELERAGAVYCTVSEDLQAFLHQDVTIFFGHLCTRQEAATAAILLSCPAAIEMAITKTDDTVAPDLFDAYPDALIRPDEARQMAVTRTLRECVEAAHTRSAKIVGLNP